MHESEVLVCFRPSGKEAYVLPGTRLVEAAAEAGIVLEVSCGGEGLCGKCRIIVSSGACKPSAAEQKWFSAEELQAGWRLACQSSAASPTDVEIPPVSRAAAEHKILARASGVIRLSDEPQVRKRYLECPRPKRGDDTPDVLRIERSLDSGPLEIDLALLREIPARLREAEFRGTAVVADGRLLDIEPGNTAADDRRCRDDGVCDTYFEVANRLADHLGVPRAAIAAFGDGATDPEDSLYEETGNE